jgi:hypothetical protein
MDKIVTLPVGTTVGKGGSNQVVKTNVPTNRVTDIKPIRHPVIVKLNNNPPQVNRFQGGNVQSRTSLNSNMNSNARFTQSSGQSQGFGRRSFMRWSHHAIITNKKGGAEMLRPASFGILFRPRVSRTAPHRHCRRRER